MKIVILSPGEPSFVNSGLGIAANALIHELKGLAKLIVIEPNNKNQEDLLLKTTTRIIDVKTALFSDEKVLEQETKIIINAQLDAYHYGNQSIKSIASRDNGNYPIKKELENYSKQVLKEVQQLEFDLIYAHDWVTLQAAVKIKEQTGKPFVAHIHSLDYDRGAGSSNSFVYDIEYKSLQKADAIIAVSQYTADILVEKYEIKPEVIQVVHNAIHPIKLPKVKKTIPEKLVLFVGRLTGQKGPEIFVQIAEDLLRKRDDVRFVMVGNGELLKELIERGASPLSNGKLHFTGNINHKDVLKLYAMSDVYCMPSVSEPFGLSAIEAAAAGVPVVLSRQSGAAEVLTGAHLANHWDVKSFVDSIEHILNNPAIAKKSVAKNYDAIKGLTWAKAAKQVNAIFNSLAN